MVAAPPPPPFNFRGDLKISEKMSKKLNLGGGGAKILGGALEPQCRLLSKQFSTASKW